MPKQLEFRTWGGKRKNAGRKRRSTFASHVRRGRINRQTPVHLTLRLRDGLTGLRSEKFLAQFRKAAVGATKKGLRILHYSLQTNHFHILAEADNNQILANAMKSLVTCLAIWLKKMWRRKGSIFSERFHSRILRTPTEVKRVLRYILLNYARHAGVSARIDYYSSGHAFSKWQELLNELTDLIREQVAQEVDPDNSRGLSQPESWLASVGWLKSTA